MRAPLFLIVYLVTATVLAGYAAGGWWTFFTVFAVFGLVPIADLIAGVDKTNPDPAKETELSERRVFRYITWAAVPVQAGLVVWALGVATSGTLTAVEWAGLAVSMGIHGGVMGINVAHELVHKHNAWERTLGYVLLWTVGYQHWGVEHVKGHHRWVATAQDPATAKFGQSFYRFFPQTFFGTYRSAWNIEADLQRRKGRHPINPRNPVFTGYLVQAAVLVAVTWAFGPLGLAFFAAQALGAIALLEIVNYLEHYGLLRGKDEDGKTERVSPLHSWNASNFVTNYFLFNLQRHSDHHAKPARRYQILRHFDESPQLPTGYAGMVLLAAVPPLWFKVMDPKVKAYRSQTGMAAV